MKKGRKKQQQQKKPIHSQLQSGTALPQRKLMEGQQWEVSTHPSSLVPLALALTFWKGHAAAMPSTALAFRRPPRWRPERRKHYHGQSEILRRLAGDIGVDTERESGAMFMSSKTRCLRWYLARDGYSGGRSVTPEISGDVYVGDVSRTYTCTNVMCGKAYPRFTIVATHTNTRF